MLLCHTAVFNDGVSQVCPIVKLNAFQCPMSAPIISSVAPSHCDDVYHESNGSRKQRPTNNATLSDDSIKSFRGSCWLQILMIVGSLTSNLVFSLPGAGKVPATTHGRSL